MFYLFLMNAALRASSISFPLRTILSGFSANGLKSFGLAAFPFFGSRMRLTARAMSDEVCWVQQEKAELDTQLIIAEMQGYAPYAHEMKARIIGLMAAIRKFTAALRK